MNRNELVAKATRGELSRSELDAVVRDLVTGIADPYEALLVLGRAGATQHRQIVERYLHASDDPMLARLAVQVLCRYWGLASEYREVLEQFIRKVDWDQDDDVRLMAIDCVGSYWAGTKDRGLLRLLLEIFADERERQIVREAAYSALALAAGKKASELPAASRHFDFASDVDPWVLSSVEAALGNEDCP